METILAAPESTIVNLGSDRLIFKLNLQIPRYQYVCTSSRAYLQVPRCSKSAPAGEEYYFPRQEGSVSTSHLISDSRPPKYILDARGKPSTMVSARRACRDSSSLHNKSIHDGDVFVPDSYPRRTNCKMMCDCNSRSSIILRTGVFRTHLRHCAK